jgi:hypothetical protein
LQPKRSSGNSRSARTVSQGAIEKGVARIADAPISQQATVGPWNLRPADRLVSRPQGRQAMSAKNPAIDPGTDGTKQVPARPHDSGSAANETVDGLDATTEALRHATEDTPSGTGRGDIEKTPVFDRAGQAPKI